MLYHILDISIVTSLFITQDPQDEVSIVSTTTGPVGDMKWASQAFDGWGVVISNSIRVARYIIYQNI